MDSFRLRDRSSRKIFSGSLSQWRIRRSSKWSLLTILKRLELLQIRWQLLFKKSRRIHRSRRVQKGTWWYKPRRLTQWLKLKRTSLQSTGCKRQSLKEIPNLAQRWTTMWAHQWELNRLLKSTKWREAIKSQQRVIYKQIHLVQKQPNRWF